ncbi:MAG: hypothetical protein P8Y27_16550 [Chromatiaceae bacterium]
MDVLLYPPINDSAGATAREAVLEHVINRAIEKARLISASPAAWQIARAAASRP